LSLPLAVREKFKKIGIQKKSEDDFYPDTEHV
jgi:hypothetical protein